MLPKFCKDCRWSLDDPMGLRCQNPIVNANDQWALSADDRSSKGSSCAHERGLKFMSFPKCGMKGKLWESKWRK